MRKSDETCAVVVAFRPKEEIAKNISALQVEVGQVVVIDNTPGPEMPQILAELERTGQCIVLRKGENLGIAAALNAGMQYAVDHGFEWIATFDQDSRIVPGFFHAMRSCYARLPDPEKISLLFPRYQDARLGTFFSAPTDHHGDVAMCMTSGAMVRTEIFRSHGGMEEPLFIDYVDYEYCMRLRLRGLHIQECPEAVLVHSLGRMTIGSLLGRKMLTTNHSGRRRYYINRNRTVLILRYATKCPGWAFHEFKGLVMDAVKVFWLEPEKWEKLRYVFLGVFDGLLGRLGKRVEL